jgi:hypothetical protein
MDTEPLKLAVIAALTAIFVAIYSARKNRELKNEELLENSKKELDSVNKEQNEKIIEKARLLKINLKEANDYFSISGIESISSNENPKNKLDEKHEKHSVTLYDLMDLVENHFPNLKESAEDLIKYNNEYRDRLTQVFLHRNAENHKQSHIELGIVNGLILSAKRSIKEIINGLA